MCNCAIVHTNSRDSARSAKGEGIVTEPSSILADLLSFQVYRVMATAYSPHGNLLIIAGRPVKYVLLLPRLFLCVLHEVLGPEWRKLPLC